ncbi:hypothetical protein ERX37_04705 [Macrococcus hajekii]|uniref:Uncharacterized protein n=1 Tax=Macrococcus hajekii TaxID=198482 RepID=A0A4R6BNM8_9STAP|nr:N-acetylmuramoyl-L-alanine amidase [Macrococcus hajekii]TDM03388.1 hypothetical protein ERX37_04705 [Macrococcus hajekii]GGA98444.1 hypothetical protein GCM10007190_03070 [Macrococcus hajekii]
MNSNYFYKTSSLLLTLFAASTAAAHAAENQTISENNDSTDQKASDTTEAAVTYPVKQVIDASAKPYNLEETTEQPLAQAPVQAQNEVTPSEQPLAQAPVQAEEEVATAEQPVAQTPVQAEEEVATAEQPVAQTPVQAEEEVATAEQPVAQTPVQAQNEVTPAEQPVAQTPVQAEEEVATAEQLVTQTPVQAQEEVATAEQPVVQEPVQAQNEVTPAEQLVTQTPVQAGEEVTPAEQLVTQTPVQAGEEVTPAEQPGAQAPVQAQNEVTPAEQPVAQAPVQAQEEVTSSEQPVTQPDLKTASFSTRTLSVAPTARTMSLTAPSTSTGSAINDYILAQNYTVPTYQQDFSSELPQIAYRNGVAKPEGVVAHETANSTSTIYGEVAYMKNNWQSAFVHAFVDDNAIIETANTDYLAWGAGASANARFIQVELVRVYGQDRFAKAINNYADYIATNLHYYDLPVDSAEYDGNGTLWSHKAVSNFLGGTDHVDPYGWFYENGYSMDELTALVTLKYNQKVNAASGTIGTPPTTTVPPEVPVTQPVAVEAPVITSVSKMARINSTSAPVYTSVTDATAVPAAQKAGLTFYVNKQALYNGKNYLALSDENGVARGWVQSSQLTQASRGSQKALTLKFKTNSMIKGLYAVPWGSEAQKIADLSSSINKDFAPTKYSIVNAVPYYYGMINNQSGWIDGRQLTLVNALSNMKTVDMMARTSQQGAVVYTDQALTQRLTNKVIDTQYYIKASATKGSEVYYQLSDNSNRIIGWTKASDLNVSTHQTVAAKPAPFKVNASATALYSIPDGGASQKIASLVNDINTFFNVFQTEKVNDYYWYKGTLASSQLTGWIRGRQLTQQSKVFTTMKPVDMMGRTSQQGAVVYTDNNLTQVLPAKIVDKQYYINTAATKGTELYYQLSDINQNVVGWTKASELNAQSHQVLNYSKNTYYINKPSFIYSIPSGGASQRLLLLKDYMNKPFNVVKAEKVGDAIWYKGTLPATNTVGWVLGQFLSAKQIAYITAPSTFNEALSKQIALPYGSKPQVVYADDSGRTLTRNATSAEVSAQMKTTTTRYDDVQQYQFLNLHQSQNISATVLNRLLVNQGILAGQGAAFAEAAQRYNINEIYLISHALLESGNGTSQLSKGMGYNPSTGQAYATTGTKYYNMFGTRATDVNTINSGIQYAYSQGWNTPAKAIIGGAQYVAQNYFGNKQFTLYEMRWNPANPATHQYATDIAWAAKNASRLADFYRRIELTGLNFLIDQYQ